MALNENSVPELVITGGDSGGKTTGIAHIKERLTQMGWRVFVVPEVAPIFIDGGVGDIEKLAREDKEKYYQVERQMLKLQLNLRNRFRELVATFPSDERVIIYDRGPMDPMAFMNFDMKKRLIEDLRLDICALRDTFDGVIHMVTAAKGAEHGYTGANNSARQLRGLDEVRSIDDQLMKTWLGNPHFRIVDAQPTFEGKLDYLFKTACHLIGVPQRLEIEKKFLIRDYFNIDSISDIASFACFMDQAYLILPNEGSVRIRKRRVVPWSLCYKTKKKVVRPGVRKEEEKLISENNYWDLMKFQEPGTRVVSKHVDCFIYKNQVFELQTFMQPTDLVLLEIELLEENELVELPPFLKVEKEVTNDPRYTSHAIARGSLNP